MTRRLLASYLLLTLAVLAALEIPLAVNYHQRLESELTGDLTKDAFALAGYSEETVEGAAQLDLQQVAVSYSQRNGARVVIVDGSGRELADSQEGVTNEDFTNRTEIEAALAGQVSTGVRYSDTLGGDLLYVAVPIASSGVVHGAVRISYSTAQLDERVRRYWLGLAGIAVISLAAAAVVGVAFARWVNRPLADLDEAARGLSRDLSVRAPAGSGPPEVRELADAFNGMAGRLEALVDAQESFVADASHQLRTPLAALRLRLENLEDTAAHLPAGEDADDLRDDLAAARAETLRLGRLVDGLLALARADRATTTEGAERLAVVDLLEERAAAWEPVAAEHGVRLGADRVPVYVRATPDRVTQALDNLIANAIEATPDGRRVRLGARPVADEDRTWIELHVTDEGPGLTEEQRARAFDRFWRARQAPSSLGGSGIGLSIAQKLVRADGGDVALRAAEGGGVDAVITLPPG